MLGPVFDATDGVDGRVSIEVVTRPRPRHRRHHRRGGATLWKTVDRPNLFIKIPAHRGGLPGDHRRRSPQGISVNVTLIFGARPYHEVMEAYLAGLEQARDNGHDLSTIHSVASFFVSRVDTEIDKRLDATTRRRRPTRR